MPAARQRSRSPCIACAVSAMIGTCAPGLALARPDRLCRLEPAHFRHLHVHEDDVEPAVPARSMAASALAPVLDRLDAVAALLQERRHELAVDGVVFGDEDAQQPRRRARRGACSARLAAASAAASARRRASRACRAGPSA